MPINTLAPAYVVLNYIGASNIPHKMVFGVLPDNLTLTTPTIKSKDGSSVAINTAMTTLVNVLKALVPSTMTYTDYDLWRKDTPTSDPLWVYNGSLAVVGTGGTGIANSQLVASWRSGAGGVGKTYVMEGSTAINLVLKPTTYGGLASAQALATYLLGNTCIIYARDNGFPIAVPKMFTKTNDALRKKTVLNA